MLAKHVPAVPTGKSTLPHLAQTHKLGRSRRLKPTCVAAEQDASNSSCQTQVTVTQVTTALKEWSVACSALGAGEQTVLFRKGGIKEPTFKPQAARFFLFPTSFHTTGDLMQPGAAERYAKDLQYEPKQQQIVPITHYAELTGAWTTFDPAVVTSTPSLHVWTEGFIDSRLKWRKGQPITVLELRTYALAEPLLIPNTEQLWGCFSWVDLAHGMPDKTSLERQAAPALSDPEFAAKQQVLRAALAKMDVQQLAL